MRAAHETTEERFACSAGKRTRSVRRTTAPGGGLPGGRPRTAPHNQHLARQPREILDEMDRIWAERFASLDAAAPR